ncbi:hypothetical protein CANARDRAFT_54411 [[Candida] arabinofermentans NRRL YB-2248]|uniref:Vta1 C-terminal domain-containing protein n=1 Tax=[Candida] arabinofermentans NRRL YB-2248 TaxID=983967 RepID=A0A1E4T8B3_9ASCO|nr:hypothetical protein CANARDRAFT_54411 [[Candida] arabinofermentans NRRL YB-2248]
MVSLHDGLPETLTESLKPARSTYSLFRKLLAKAIQSKSTKLFILSYLIGLQTVQILIKQYDLIDSNDEKDFCGSLISDIINTLEKIKHEQSHSKDKSIFKLPKILSSSKNGDDFSAVINDQEKGRLFLNDWCFKNLQKVKSIFNNGKINGQTIDLLIDCSVGLQVSMGLFPYEGDKEYKKLEQEVMENEQQKDEQSDMKVTEEISVLGDGQNAQDSTIEEAEEDQGMDNTDIDIIKESKYFEKELKVAEADISQPVNEMITEIPDNNKTESEMSSFTKDDILTKIKWCNYHTGRILACFKEGKDPNEDFSGLLSQPPFDYVEISQEEIGKVIEEAMNADSSDEYGEGEAEADEEFNEEDYYYDSDEGEYIHKSKFKEMEDAFPTAPTVITEEEEEEKQKKVIEEAKNTKVMKDEKKAVLKDEQSESESFENDDSNAKKQLLDTTTPTAADLVAKTSKYKAPSESKTDLKTLEKQMSHEDMLNSASKCCKYAMSAINYEDIKTALLELKEATKLLESYNEKVYGEKISLNDDDDNTIE